MFKKLSYLLKFKPKHPLFHLSFSFSMKLEFDGRDFISDRASVGGVRHHPKSFIVRHFKLVQGNVLIFGDFSVQAF